MPWVRQKAKRRHRKGEVLKRAGVARAEHVRARIPRNLGRPAVSSHDGPVPGDTANNLQARADARPRRTGTKRRALRGTEARGTTEVRRVGAAGCRSAA